tara:strand:+ start:1899 stop:2597 length:699 start_codon:yes stop_codon:yes gene_type:complete
MPKEIKEPKIEDYLQSYNALDQFREEIKKKPYDAKLRDQFGKQFGNGKQTFWNVHPDGVDREIFYEQKKVEDKLVENIDKNLESIIDMGIDTSKVQKTSNFLTYMASKAMPNVKEGEKPTKTQMLHSNLYRIQKVVEKRKENPQETEEIMMSILRPVYGNLMDRLTVNQPQVLDTLFKGYVEQTNQEFLEQFKYENKEKESGFQKSKIKNYVKNIMTNTDSKTKIEVYEGLA